MKNANTIHRESQQSGQSSQRRRRSIRHLNPQREPGAQKSQHSSRLLKALKRLGNGARDFIAVIIMGTLVILQWLWNKSGFFVFQAHKCCAPRKQTHNENIVRRKRRRRKRSYYFDASRGRKKKRWRIGLVAFLSILLIFSLINLGSYVIDYISARHISNKLRNEYYAALYEETVMPTSMLEAPTSTPMPTNSPEPYETPTPSPSPRTTLETMWYPNNRHAIISSRFNKIRRQNKDIIGWLTITDLIDEAVVQRDNSYYLRRDYRGYHNTNGAIFLDESCDLGSRPYTLMLFGHNMKSGAMFGCLRNYENIYFYRNNPFITFDTAYEDGRYIIFSIGTLNQTSGDHNFVDLNKLTSTKIVWREEAISQLKALSKISTSIEVNADDQILLLITCVEDEAERRVVAARRVRDNEVEERLQELAEQSRSR